MKKTKTKTTLAPGHPGRNLKYSRAWLGLFGAACLTMGGIADAQLTGQLGILNPATANGGINPATGVAWAAGDKYRLTFVTSTTIAGNISDISTYNTHVQNAAGGSTAYDNLGTVTWKAVGSTGAVDARDNTGTNPASTGVGVFQLDGSMIATSNADLWDGTILVAANKDENGATAVVPSSYVWTGSTAAGVKNGDYYLGNAVGGISVTRGHINFTTSSWILNSNASNEANAYAMRAISQELTILAADAVPPVWTGGYPTADNATPDGFTLRASIDEIGTAYYVVLADSVTTPSPAEVEAGTGNGGSPALQSGTISLTANTENTKLITGLGINTPYDVYFVAKDSLGNRQTFVQLVDISTIADNTAPNWAETYPQADTQTADGFTARSKIDEKGTVYYVVVAAGATTPTPVEVQAGTGSGGSGQLASGSFAVTANVEGTALVTGLTYTPGISFDVYFVAVDGSSNATASNLVNWTPDTTPPTWTTNYPLVDTETEQGFTVRASIIGEAGTAYYVVLTNGASPPSASQIKAGNDASDAAALNSGSLPLTADTENVAVVTGLAAGTDFDVYVVAEDSVLNPTTPVAIDIATLPIDSSAPSWTPGYPLVDAVTSSGFTVRASIDEDGTAYYLVVADGASAPSAAQIKAGTDAGDAAALASGSFSLSADTENSEVVTGLAGNTSYDIYLVAEDNALAANTTAVELREATTPISTLTVVGNIQWNDNGDRTVSVYPGNSYVEALLGGTGTPVDPAVPVNQDLGTVEAYHFVNSDEANPDAIQSYATSGGRISLPTTADTGLLNTNRCATAVYTISDPTGGIPDFSGSVTTVSGISGSVDGTIDVTGLASGTFYFIIGSGGAEGRATSLTVTQGTSTVVTAQSGGGYYQDGGTGFWANADTIAACVEVSFTNDGSSNTVSYSWDQNGAGSIIGVVLSDTTPIGGGGGYSSWATTNVGGDSAAVDTNGDGVDNGIAYFMDDAGVITLPGIDGTNTITWINGGNIAETEYGTQFKVQTSPDLATWTDVGSGDSNLVNTAGLVAYTLPTGAGKLFARLVVDPD